MNTPKKDYVEVVYNEQDRPLTGYPAQLARHLVDTYGLQPGQKLLDIGCGRGEFLRGFMDCGLAGHGVDQSVVAQRYCPGAVLKVTDLENQGIPFDDDSFDVVYSKSVIEHFHYPERMVREMFRVLKPGGLAITLCPDWEHNYRIYFEDFTHRTPFMLSSLRDIQLMHGFTQVQVARFRQLPLLWGSGRWLLPLAEVTRLLTPSGLRHYSKWVRFSKEIMLLSSARKPVAQEGGRP